MKIRYVGNNSSDQALQRPLLIHRAKVNKSNTPRHGYGYTK